MSMKRKIFIFFVILTLISSVCCLFVGCNDYVSANGHEQADSISKNEQYIDVDNEMENPYGDISYINSTIRFAYDSGYIGDTFTLLISAVITPQTMQDGILLNWGVTVGDETLDPLTYVPSEEGIIETEHFYLGYNYNVKEPDLDTGDVFTGTDLIMIQFKSAFPNTEYTIWCIYRDDPSIYDTVKLKYDGAPQKLTYGSVESTRYDYDLEESIDYVVWNNDVPDSIYFGYEHTLGAVGANYVDQMPQVRLESVESNVSMVFKYRWKDDEYATTYYVGYIVVPLIDYYTNLIYCSLTPSDTLVPVDDVVSFTQKLHPSDISERSYLNNRYYGGYLESFVGYINTPTLSTQINKPLSTSSFSYISSDEAFITYNFVDGYLDKTFSVNVTLKKNS